ncbi:MAG: LEPR-XLL domain-containing protein, partial [Gammaproteobacteria bacterium]|nr:LEPR-XLL domain-containing protein [Gammaproteobacteria bacterium]
MSRHQRKPLSELIARLLRQPRRARRAQAEPSRFVFEGLEPRMLMSADPLTASVAGGAEMTLRVVEENQQQVLQVVELDEQGVSQVVASRGLDEAKASGGVVIQGSDAQDILRVDQSLLGQADGLLVSFQGGDGDDVLALEHSQGLTITFAGGEGDDRIEGIQGNTEWQVSADGAGSVDWSSTTTAARNDSWLSFTGIETVNAASYRQGDDGVLSATDDAAQHRLSSSQDGARWSLYDEGSLGLGNIAFNGIDRLDGRAGQILDFSDFSTSVEVDLGTGKATGFVGIDGFNHVIGTGGDDRLIGDVTSQVDTILDGGNGNNLIVGGGGDDTLKAGAGRSTLVSVSGSDRFEQSELGSEFTPEEAELTYVVQRASGDITLTSAGATATVTTGDGSLSFQRQPVELVLSAAGTGQTLNASGYSLSGVTFQSLDGASNSQLVGSAQDDRFVLSAGGGSVQAGGGNDRIEASADADMTLTDTALSVTGWTNWVLGDVELATLVGGASANMLDASAFSGSVQLEGVAGDNTLKAGAGDAVLLGGSGNDILVGGVGDDVLFGNRGSNSLDGGSGSDSVLGSTSHSLRLFGGSGSATLVRGDVAEERELVWSRSAGETVVFHFAGEQTDALAWDADALAVQQALEALSAVGEGNLQVARELFESAGEQQVRWRVSFIGDFMAVADDGAFAKALVGSGLALGASGASATVTSTQVRAREAGRDSLVGIEHGMLRAEFGDTVLDASGFAGSVYLQGGSGNDLMIGGEATTQFVAVAGDNVIRAGAGQNEIRGGVGQDRLEIVLADGQNAVNVSGDSFSIDGGTASSYRDIEALTLVGNAGANTLDASGWHGVGEQTRVTALMAAGGASNAEIETFLSALGDAIPGAEDFASQAEYESYLARYVTGSELENSGAHLSFTLQNGVTRALNVADARTLGDLLVLLGSVEGLTASFDGASGRLVVTDTTTGSASFAVSADATAKILTDALGMGVSADKWQSTALSGTGVVLDASAGGSDALIGSRGDDRIVVVSGAASVAGGAGTDSLLAAAGDSMTLTDTGLVVGSATTTLSGIEAARLSLTGGADKTLTATAFTGALAIDIAEAATDTIVNAKPGDQVEVELAAGSLARLDDVTVREGASLVGYWDGDASLSNVTRTFSSSVELRADGALTLDNVDLSMSDPTQGHDLSILARELTIGGDSVIDAGSGELHLGAQLFQPLLAPANGLVDVGLFDLSVDIDKATLKGGDVTIDARLVDPDRDWFNLRTGVAFLDQGIDTALDFLQGLSLFGSVSVMVAEVAIDIGSDAVITATSGDITVASELDISTEVGASKAWGLGVSVSTLITRSSVHVHGTLSAANDINLSSSVSTAQSVSAEPDGLKGVAGAVAVSVLVSDSRVMVWEDASLSAGNDLVVAATSVEENETSASSAPDKGKVGIALAINVETSNTEAQLAGDVSVGGDLTLSAETSQGEDHGGTSASAGTAPGGGPDSLVDGATASAEDLSPTSVIGNFQEALSGVIGDKIKEGIADRGPASIGEHFKESQGQQKNALDVAAALAVSVDINRAEARLGTSVTRLGAIASQRSDIEVAGAVSVSATSAHRPAVSAEGSATGVDPNKKEKEESFTDKVLGNTLIGKLRDAAAESEIQGTDSAKDQKEDSQAADVGVAGGFVFALQNNHADAVVEGLVDLDAGDAISVTAESLNSVDMDSLWGRHLYVAGKALGELDGTYDHASADGAADLTNGDKVLVADDHQRGGEAGLIYQFEGADVSGVDLASEDFSDDSRWTALSSPLQTRIEEFVEALNAFTTGNLGISGSFDSWTVATAEGVKLAIAGAANVFLVNQDSEARIREGARINLGGATDVASVTPSDEQQVEVIARSDNHLLSLVGNLSLPTFAGADEASAEAWRDAFKSDIDTIKSGFAGIQSDGSAIGASIGVHLLGADTRAVIETGVALVASSLDVRADSDTLLIGAAVSGGKADKVAFNATSVANIVDNTTLAQIQDGVSLNIGAVSVDGANGPALRVGANDDTYAFGIGGSVASGKSAGVGVSAVVSVMERDTRAVIGGVTTPASASGSITVGGDLLVEANNGGVVANLALAGAKAGSSGTSGLDSAGDASGSGAGGGSAGGSATKDDPNKWPNNQSNYDSVLKELSGKLGGAAKASSGGSGGTSSTSSGGDQKGSFGLGVSGSVVVNIADYRTEALIQGIETLKITGKTSVAAKDSSHLGMLAGGAALSLGSSGTQVAVAGAAALAFDSGITRARIDRVTSFDTGGLALSAAREGWTVVAAAGVAVASGAKGFGVAGAASVLTSARTVDAGLLNIQSGDLGDVSVVARDAANTVLIAGAVAGAGKAGVGGAAAFADISHDVDAHVEALGSASESLVIGGLSVQALSDTLIISLAGSAGIGTGPKGVGLAGTAAVNLIDNATQARVVDSFLDKGSDALAPAPKVEINAEDNSSVWTLAGAVGVGGTAGFGAGVSVNSLSNQTQALISGGVIANAGAVSVVAANTGLVRSLTLGIGASTKFAGSGSVSVNQIANTLRSSISNANVSTVGQVLVATRDRAELVAISGAGAGAGKVALAGSVSVNLIDNNSQALIQNASVSAGGDVVVDAEASSLVVSVALGGAGAGKVGLAGAVSVNLIKGKVEALIDGGRVESSTGDIRIQATDSAQVVVVAIGAAGAGTVAGGVSSGTVQVDNAIVARVTGATLIAGGDVAVWAGLAERSGRAALELSALGLEVDPATQGTETNPSTGSSDIAARDMSNMDWTAGVINLTIAGAGAGSVAGSAAVGLNWLRSSVLAEVSGGASITAADSVSVLAQDKKGLVNFSFGAAGAGNAAGGAAIAFNYLGGDPSDPSRTVDNTSDQNVDASEDAFILQGERSDHGYSVGQIAALIDASSVTATSGDVLVDARSEASMLNITAGGAGAGAVALAGSIGINFMQNDVLASIGNGAVVRASAGDVSVHASVAPIMINVAGAAAGAGSVGLAGASATNDMASAVSASILGASTEVTAGGRVDVKAELIRITDVPSVKVDDSLIPPEDSDENRPATPGQGDQVWSFALAGAGAGKVAVAGALSLNWLRGSVTAVIDQATVSATGDIALSASDDLGLNAFTVAGSGAGAFALAGYLAYNYIGGDPDDPTSDSANRIHALIKGGASVASSAGKVSLSAVSSSSISAYSLGGAVAGFAALSGTTSLNFTRKDVVADIRDSATEVSGAGGIAVSASDTSAISAASAQVNVAVKGGAAGLSVAYLDIDNSILAGSQGATLDSSGGDIAIDARSRSTNLIVIAGVSYGTFGAGAGNAGSSLINNTSVARIDGGSVDAAGNVSVVSDSKDVSTITLGTVSVGAVALGGGVGVDLLGSTSEAWIGGGARVSAGAGGAAVSVRDDWNNGWTTDSHKGVVVLATSEVSFTSVAVTAAGAAGNALAANVVVDGVTGATRAYIDKARIDSTADVVVRALHRGDADSGGGAAAVSGGSSGAAGVDVTLFQHKTEAFISGDGFDHSAESDGLMVKAGGDVAVEARADVSFLSTVMGAAVGLNGVAGAGSASVVDLSLETLAYLKDVEVAGTNVAVRADNDVDGRFIVGAVAGGSVGFGASLALGLLNPEARVSLDKAIVTASNDIAVSASQRLDLGITVATAGGGAVGVAGAVSVMTADAVTQVLVSGDSELNAGNDVLLEASTTTLVNERSGPAGYLQGVGAAAVGAAGFGASVDVMVLREQTRVSVADGAQIIAGGDVTAEARLSRTLNSTVIAFAGSGSLSLSGAISVISLGKGLSEESFERVEDLQDLVSDTFAGFQSGEFAMKAEAEDSDSGTDTPLDSDEQAAFDGDFDRPDDAGNHNKANRTSTNSALSTLTAGLSGDTLFDVKSPLKVGDTAATLGRGVTITAGGDVSVKASEALKVQTLTGSGAVSGVASVGLSVGVVELNGAVTAQVGHGSTLDAADAIKVASDYDGDVSISAYGGSAAPSIAVGGQVAILLDRTQQLASLEGATSAAGGTLIKAADRVDIVASADRDYSLRAAGGAIGLVAAGVSVGTVEISGATRAWVGEYTRVGENQSVGSLNVSATSIDRVALEVVAVAAGMAGGSANVALVTLSQEVQAWIGDGARISLSDALSINASLTPAVQIKTLGVSVAAGVGIGVSVVEGELKAKVLARVGTPGSSAAHDIRITAGSMDVAASLNTLAGGNSLTGEALGSAGGALLGVDATLVTLKDSTEVVAEIADTSLEDGSGSLRESTNLAIAGRLDVTSDLNSRLSGKSSSIVGGLVAAGAAKVTVEQRTVSRARIGSGNGVLAGDASVRANGQLEATLDALAGSGGVAAGAGAATHVTQHATTEALIGAAELLLVKAAGNSGLLTVHADQSFDVDARIMSVSGGVFAGSGAESRYWITANTLAEVGDKALLKAAAIDVFSDTRLDKQRLAGTDDGNIRGVAGGAVAGAGASSVARLDLNTRVVVGEDAYLHTSDGDLRLAAKNQVVFKEKVNLTAGGLASGAGITVDILTTNLAASVEIKSNAELVSQGELLMSARGGGDLAATLLMDTYGAATVGVGSAKVVVTPDNRVTVRGGAKVSALGNIDIVAGGSAQGERDRYAVSAVLDSFAGSIIPIDDLNALAKMDQTNRIEVASGAEVIGARDILLFTERFGFSDMEARAKGVNWLSAVGSAIDAALGSGGAQLVDGDVETDADADVIIDGRVETGLGRHKTLVLGVIDVTQERQDIADLNSRINALAEALNSTSLTPAERTQKEAEMAALEDQLAAKVANSGNYIVAETGHDDIGFAVSVTPGQSGLVDELQRIREAYNVYRNSGNTRLVDFYQGEIARLEQALVDEGYGEKVNGQLIVSRVDELTITLDDVWAQAGAVYVYADDLSGGGHVEAPTDASITILNKAPSRMVLGDIEIPQVTGGLYLNLTQVASSAEIDAINASESAGLTVEGDPGAQNGQPRITVVNSYGVAFDENDANQKKIRDVLMGALGYSDAESLYDRRIFDTAPPSSLVFGGLTRNISGELIGYAKGSISVENEMRAESILLSSPGELTIKGLSQFNPGGNADAAAVRADGDDGAGALDADALSAIANSASASPQVEARSIVIDAEYVNLNGYIRAGVDGYDLTIGAADAQRIADHIRSGSSGNLTLSASSGDALVIFNGHTRQIEVTGLAISGGKLDITGHIANTGNGKLEVLGGYGAINITNNTSYTLAVGDLDVSRHGEGYLRIADKYKGSSANPLVTEYRYDFADPGKTYTYTPDSDVRYGFSVVQDSSKRRYAQTASSAWAGIDAFAADPDTLNWGESEISPGRLQDSLSYFYTSSETGYQYNKSEVNASEWTDPQLVDKWSTSTWYGKKTHYAKFVQEQSSQILHTHSVAANNSVNISFFGQATGSINIDSVGDVVVLGDLANYNGETRIDSDGQILHYNDPTRDVRVSGASVVLRAADGIGDGSALKLLSIEGAGGAAAMTMTVDAVTERGPLNLAHENADLIVLRAHSGWGDVSLSAEGSLKAGSALGGVHVKGNNLSLAAGDAIGSLAAPLTLAQHADGRLNAVAGGDIAIDQLSGDLGIERVESRLGDVWVRAAGNLLDRNDAATVDERTVEQLRDGVWSQLNLVGSAAEQKIQDAQDDLATRKTQEYNTYWNYRQATSDDWIGGLADGTSYSVLSVDSGAILLGLVRQISDGSGGTLEVRDELRLSAPDIAAGDARVAHRFYRADGSYFTIDSLNDLSAEGLILASGAGVAQGNTLTYRRVASYASDQVIRLSQAERDAYRQRFADQGLDDAQIEARLTGIESDRTDIYHELHDVYGSATEYQDASYRVTLSAAEKEQVRGSIKVWTEQELLSLIGAGLLQETTDTRTEIQEPNVIAGGDITLIAGDSVGVARGRELLDMSGGLTGLSDEQRVLLSAAERADVTYLKQAPHSAVVDFLDIQRDQGVTTVKLVRTDGQSWDTSVFKVGEAVDLAGKSLNVTENGRYYTVTAISGGTLELSTALEVVGELGAQVELATVLLDPQTQVSSGEQLIRYISINLIDDFAIENAGDTFITAANSAYVVSETDIRLAKLVAGQDARVKVSGSILAATSSGADLVIRTSDLVLEAASGQIGSGASAPLKLALTDAATLTARAQGDISLHEIEGDLAISTLFTERGDLWLKAAGSIIDGLNHDLLKVLANNITLIAGDSVGQATNAIELATRGDGVVTVDAGEDVYLAAVDGNLRVGHIKGGERVELSALNSIIATHADELRGDIEAKTLQLETGFGGVGAADRLLALVTDDTAGRVDIDSADSVFVREVKGDLRLGTVQAGPAGSTDALAFVFSQGAIYSALGANETFNLLTAGVRLIAVKDVGTKSKVLTSRIGTLEGQSRDGKVYLNNTGHLTIHGLGLTATGDIEITANSPITVTEDIVSADGDIVLTARENTSDANDNEDYLHIEAGVTLDAGRDILMTAGDDLLFKANDIIVKAARHVVMKVDTPDEDQPTFRDTPEAKVELRGDWTVAGDITLEGGDKRQTVLIAAGASLKADSMSVALGGGDDALTQQGSLDITQQLNIAGGDGDNSVTIEGSVEAASLRIDGNAGVDTVTFNGTHQVGSLSLSLGAGDNVLSVSDTLTVTNAFDVETTGGDDRITFDASIQAGSLSIAM